MTPSMLNCRSSVGVRPFTPCFGGRPATTVRFQQGHTRVVAQAHATDAEPQVASRRGALLTISTAAALAVASLVQTQPASAATAAAVGKYLPLAGVEDLVQYKPEAQKTPALRAGVIKPAESYKFALEPSFSEVRISNNQSGNFCMPNCGEPWTEALFISDKEGKMELLAAPLLKLTNAKNAKIEDLGNPEALLQRIGPYITGTYLGEDDLIASSSTVKDDGRTYYLYELNSPGALINPRSLTTCVTKGDVLYMFITSASEKQWARGQGKLRTMQETFRA